MSTPWETRLHAQDIELKSVTKTNKNQTTIETIKLFKIVLDFTANIINVLPVDSQHIITDFGF